MPDAALTPYLTFPDSKKAIEFYRKAFGAETAEEPLLGPDGSVVHGDIHIGSSAFMFADENPEFGTASPQTLGGTPVRFSLVVDDADAWVARAVAAGAEVVIPVDDQFYGHRSGRIQDPFGYQWIVANVVEDMPRDEMQRRADELFGGRS